MRMKSGGRMCMLTNGDKWGEYAKECATLGPQQKGPLVERPPTYMYI